MNQNIINARVTFRNSPIHILEQFTIKDMKKAYEQFKTDSGLDECVIIQTCNRIELFGKSKTYDSEKIKKTWATITGLEEEAFNDNIEFVENHDALHHLLKLTSGLDSMVFVLESVLLLTPWNLILKLVSIGDVMLPDFLQILYFHQLHLFQAL